MGDLTVGFQTSYSIWSYDMHNSTTSATGSVTTSCNVSGLNIEMRLKINDMNLDTYDLNFVLSGSITYQ